jgi:tRNA pseudouridine38-40 synthase
VYQYRIIRGGISSPFVARYVSDCRWPLDLEAMQSAADLVVGERDFTSFAAFDPDRTARLADEDGSGCNANGTRAENSSTPLCNNIRRIETSTWTRESGLSLPSALGTMLIGPQPDLSEGGSNGTAGEMFTYTVCGNGFLHHMVRNLVGTFIEVGRGRLAAGEIPRILASRDRAMAGPTAAARGLCLMKVLY